MQSPSKLGLSLELNYSQFMTVHIAHIHVDVLTKNVTFDQNSILNSKLNLQRLNINNNS